MQARGLQGKLLSSLSWNLKKLARTEPGLASAENAVFLLSTSCSTLSLAPENFQQDPGFLSLQNWVCANSLPIPGQRSFWEQSLVWGRGKVHVLNLLELLARTLEEKTVTKLLTCDPLQSRPWGYVKSKTVM